MTTTDTFYTPLLGSLLVFNRKTVGNHKSKNKNVVVAEITYFENINSYELKGYILLDTDNPNMEKKYEFWYFSEENIRTLASGKEINNHSVVWTPNV